MSVPESLLEMQRWVAQIVSLPLRQMGEDGLPIFEKRVSLEVEERISPGPFLTAEQRIGLYNQQYWFRLFIILQEQYPTLTRLFGFTSFNRELAEPYLLHFPPSHWSLSTLGARLSEWIEKEYKEEDKVLVYEAALVDAAYERIFYAGSFDPLDSEDFSRAKSEPLFLQPTVQLLSLHADLFCFRSELLSFEPEHWVGADFPPIQWGDLHFYTLSKAGIYEEIGSSELILLKAFQKGSTLRAACKNLSIDVEPFIADWFKKWVQRGWLYL